MSSAASDRVMLWASVNGADDDQQPAHRAAEQQQADQEQEMVRTDQDVMDAGAGEPPADRQGAVPRAGEILQRAALRVQDGLRSERRPS